MDMTYISDEIRKHIVEDFLCGDDRGLHNDTDLHESGILDSFAILELVTLLDERFYVHFEPEDIDADNFRNIGTITQLVLRYLAKNEASVQLSF